MFSIRTLNKISPVGLRVLPAEKYQVTDDAADPDAILVRSADLHELEFNQSLLAIARAGAGVNNIPIDRCSERGVVVFNTPGANANSVKELVVVGLLLSSRRILEGVRWVKEHAAEADLAKMIEKEKKRFAGQEITGKTLGVAGLGAIGVMVANAALALGMRVTGYDPFISVESAWGLSRQVSRVSSLDVLLAQSDYVTIHVPLTDNTRGMIGATQLSTMKKGSCLLNFSRGGLVDESVIAGAIESGRIGAYVTDFPSEGIAGLDGVIPIPHLGASTDEAEDNCATMAAEQLIAFFESGNITNSVNFPACELDRAGNNRIVVANRNIPNVVGQITSTLASESLNIADMLNRNRGELAYTIIDVDGQFSESMLDQMRTIDGVINLRVIKDSDPA